MAGITITTIFKSTCLATNKAIARPSSIKPSMCVSSPIQEIYLEFCLANYDNHACAWTGAWWCITFYLFLILLWMQGSAIIVPCTMVCPVAVCCCLLTFLLCFALLCLANQLAFCLRIFFVQLTSQLSNQNILLAWLAAILAAYYSVDSRQR